MLLTAAAAATGLAVAARAAVVLGARCRDSKRERNWRVLEYRRRNPPPLLTLKELRKRVTKVQLLRREDLTWLCEFHVYLDPREEKYQWSVEEVKRQMESPDYKSIEKEREAAGAPMPPYTMMDSALAKMRAGTFGRTMAKETTEEESSEDAKGKKKPAKKKSPGSAGIDLSNIDVEFVAYKGIQLSKKQMAKLQSKDKKGK